MTRALVLLGRVCNTRVRISKIFSDAVPFSGHYESALAVPSSEIFRSGALSRNLSQVVPIAPSPCEGLSRSRRRSVPVPPSPFRPAIAGSAPQPAGRFEASNDRVSPTDSRRTRAHHGPPSLVFQRFLTATCRELRVIVLDPISTRYAASWCDLPRKCSFSRAKQLLTKFVHRVLVPDPNARVAYTRVYAYVSWPLKKTLLRPI